MSDSGRCIGDCRHGNTPEWCVHCLREEVAKERERCARIAEGEADVYGIGLWIASRIRGQT